MRCTLWLNANQMIITTTIYSNVKYAQLKKNFQISLSDVLETMWTLKMLSSCTIAFSCRATPLGPTNFFFTAKYDTPYGGRRHCTERI